MPRTIVKPTAIHMSVGYDGLVILTMPTGTGEYELQISPDEWAKLGVAAKWFDEYWAPADQLRKLVAERDAAVEKARALEKAMHDAAKKTHRDQKTG